MIVDRSVYHDGTVGLLGGVLKGQVVDPGRPGLLGMLDALRGQLARSPRFEVRTASEELPGNSLSDDFPPPLPWEQVDALLQKYQADLVLAVEIFNTDFVVTDGRRMVKRTVTDHGEKKEVDVPEFQVDLHANLTIGLRLYDPRSRRIVDDAVYHRGHSWQARGSTHRDAMQALIGTHEAAARLSRTVGTTYASRIAPMPIVISRTFHAKSKRVPEMEIGARHADVGDWEQAAQVWQQGLAQAPAKEAGQLCYNIAVACEVLGDWENARQWAQRAYVEYGDKEARAYVTQLEEHIRQDAIASEQMP